MTFIDQTEWSTQQNMKFVENYELTVQAVFKFTSEQFHSESSVTDQKDEDLGEIQWALSWNPTAIRRKTF
jgi:hypothetical protein